MQNLFDSSSRYRLTYWLIWLLFGAIYAVLLQLAVDMAWMQLGFDALVFSGLFATMGIAVWYVVKFSPLEAGTAINTLITHVVAASLLVFLIVSGAELILSYVNRIGPEFYEFDSSFHIYRLIAGGMIYIFLAINFYLIMYYEEFRSRKLRQAALDHTLRSAELNMLKAQINPHFIFNSLNSVSSLALTDPQKAHEMVIQLADFLRYTINKNADQLVSLEQEIEAIDLFMAIEKTRYGPRLNIEISCDEKSKKMKLPALILQPLIENAVKYSLHESDDESIISVICSGENDLLKVEIVNNFDSTIIGKMGEGIGLANVKARLNLVYSRQELLITTKDDNMFKVEISFPQ